MKHPSLALLPILGLAAMPVLADSYRVQVDAGVSVVDSRRYDINLAGISGRYYFDQVDTSQGPLDEAAFLAKASSVALAYTGGELEFDDDRNDYDIEAVGGSFRYVLPGTDLILGLNLAESESNEVDFSTFGFTFGYYLTETSTLELDIAQTEDDDDSYYLEEQNYALHYRYLWLGEGLSLAVEASAGRTEWEDGDESSPDEFGSNWVSLGLVHYVSNSLSINVGGRVSHQDAELTSYFGGVKYFIGGGDFAVALQFFTEKDDVNDIRNDGMSLNLTGRF